MKRVVFYLCMVLGILCLITGCGSSTSEVTENTEEEEPVAVEDGTTTANPENTEGLVGTWSGTVDQDNIKGDVVYEFNEDNTFTVSVTADDTTDAEAASIEETGTYTTSEDTLELAYDEGEELNLGTDEDSATAIIAITSFTYKVSDDGNTLTLTNPSDNMSFELTKSL